MHRKNFVNEVQYTVEFQQPVAAHKFWPCNWCSLVGQFIIYSNILSHHTWMAQGAWHIYIYIYVMHPEPFKYDDLIYYCILWTDQQVNTSYMAKIYELQQVVEILLYTVPHLRNFSYAPILPLFFISIKVIHSRKFPLRLTCIFLLLVVRNFSMLFSNDTPLFVCIKGMSLYLSGDKMETSK